MNNLGPLLIDRLDQPNPTPANNGDMPAYQPKVGKAKSRMPAVLALAVIAGVLGVVAGLWLWLADLWRYDQEFRLVVRLALFALIVGGTVGVLYMLLAWGRRVGLIDQPGGVKVTWEQQQQLPVGLYVQNHFQVYQTWANRNMPNVTTYTVNNPGPVTETKPAPLALPAPSESLTPASEWLALANESPHLLIAGRTNAGKTTFAEALLHERAGEDVVILDPHYQPGKWLGLAATAGSGNNYDQILAFLPELIGELDRRYREFAAGRSDFPRLTVLIDEVPGLVVRATRGSTVDPRWTDFAKRLGSEARKIKISVWLLSQSTLVEDLKINSSLRMNFSRVGLGDQARELLRQEQQHKRREGLLDLLAGQAYPAVMESRGQYAVLDTSGVPTMARAPLARPLVTWQPPQTIAPLNRKEWLDRARQTAQTMSREERMRLAAVIAKRGYPAYEVAYGSMLRDEDAGRIWREARKATSEASGK